MKLIAITDIHGDLTHLPLLDKEEFDILIVCGDLTNFGGAAAGREVLAKLAERLVETFRDEDRIVPEPVIPAYGFRDLSFAFRSDDVRIALRVNVRDRADELRSTFRRGHTLKQCQYRLVLLRVRRR